MAERYRLYVPTAGAIHHVRPGSAIVGEARDGLVATDYEGGGADNVRTLEERIHHAAGRRAANYPTTARRGWSPDDLVDVGSVRYDATLRRWVIEAIDDADALEAWAGETPAPGGSEALRAEAAGLLWNRLPLRDRTAIAAERLGPAELAERVIAAAARTAASS